MYGYMNVCISTCSYMYVLVYRYHMYRFNCLMTHSTKHVCTRRKEIAPEQ